MVARQTLTIKISACKMSFRLMRSVTCLINELKITNFSGPTGLIPHTCSPLSPKGSIFNQQSKRWAGHSKWQNIRHIKAAKDNEKQKIANQIVRRMKIAMIEGGSTDPSQNLTLSRLLEEGKSKSVPKDTMVNCIKRMNDKKGGSQKIVYEARGPGNSLYMIEALTDRKTFTKNQLRHVSKKVGGSVGDTGYASHAFTLSGVVYVPLVQEERELNEDDAFELAVEAGAEEIEATFDESHNAAFQLLCDPKEMHAVKKAVESKDIQVSNVRMEYIPHTFAFLNPKELELASKYMDLLEEVEDVVKVYSNINEAVES